MKVSANVVAILAWASVLAALWCGYALPPATRPPFGTFLVIVLASALVGIIVPAYLVNLSARPGTATERPGGRATPAEWVVKTTTRQEPPPAGRDRGEEEGGRR